MSHLKTFSPFLPDSNVFKMPTHILLHKPKNVGVLKIIEAILVPILQMDRKIHRLYDLATIRLANKADSYPVSFALDQNAYLILVHSM